MPSLREAQLRHAVHYETVVGDLNDLYLGGGAALDMRLSRFNQEWLSIQLGWAQAKTLSAEDETAARLCSSYPRVAAALLNMCLPPQERLRWLKVGLECARRLKDRGAEGRHLGDLGMAYAALGEKARAVECFVERRRIARETEDRLGEAAALGNLGNIYVSTRNLRRAIEYYEQALAAYRGASARRGEADALSNLAVALRDSGRIASAVLYHESALAIYREIGYRRGEGQTLNNLGVIYRKVGNQQRALKLFGTALLTFREMKDPRGEAFALWNMGMALEKQLDRERAIAHAEAALLIFTRLEDSSAAEVERTLARWGVRTQEGTDGKPMNHAQPT